MATVDRSEANQKMLQQTNEVQDKTKEAIWRIQRQAAEAEQIGTKTLDELRRQGQQMVSKFFVRMNSAYFLPFSL